MTKRIDKKIYKIMDWEESPQSKKRFNKIVQTS